MTPLFLGLGSNLGDRSAHLARAREALVARGLLVLPQASPVVESIALGPVQPDFLNQVLAGESDREARDLYLAIKEIERDLGRAPGDRWGPRVIDIDILAFGALQMATPELTIPHPGIEEREFVLAPWASIAPDYIPPGFGKSIAEMLAELRARKGGVLAGRVIDR